MEHELHIFIGYSSDARKEVSGIKELESDLQEHLDQLNELPIKPG